MKMHHQRRRLAPIIWLLGLLVLPMLSCSLPDLPDLSGNSVLPTVTPLGDTLSFLVPVYTANLEPGDTIPGTALTYVAANNDAYDVTIDGLSAVKRAGDSFAWSGVLAPGVSARYNLRLATTFFGNLTAAGPVEITVYNPRPAVMSPGETVDGSLAYSNVPVQYRVTEGGPIPGTTLTYTGYVDPDSASPQQVAQRMARLAGTTGYPFVALGDSLTWSGQLRDNFFIRYNLRVAAIDDNGLRLAGTADLWVQPPR